MPAAKTNTAARSSREGYGKIDVATLVIEDTPRPSKPPTRDGKFTHLFKQLKPGQCIRCKPEEVGAIANSLGDWLLKSGKSNVLGRSAMRQCEDGFGRVWLIERKPSEAAAPGKKQKPKTSPSSDSDTEPAPKTQLANAALWSALSNRPAH